MVGNPARVYPANDAAEPALPSGPDAGPSWRRRALLYWAIGIPKRWPESSLEDAPASRVVGASTQS